MEDFQQLNRQQQARWERWQQAYRQWLAAGVALAAAVAQARLAERLEARLDSAKPDQLILRASLLQRQADALKAIKRSTAEQHLAKARMARLFGSWKP